MNSKKSATESRIGIVTIWDTNNYGNRLQNYALQTILEKLARSVETIPDDLPHSLRYWKSLLGFWTRACGTSKNQKSRVARRIVFSHFSGKMIHKTPEIFDCLSFLLRFRHYDAYIVGSDQVWNPRFGHLHPVDLLRPFKTGVRVAYAASFGADDLEFSEVQEAADHLRGFDALSVRETSGKELLEQLTGRADIEVLVDPTLLLTAEEWRQIAQKPCKVPHRFVLCYFLGDVPTSRKQEIDALAGRMNCEIVDLTDPASQAYVSGPSEFLWYAAHAELVCTDSFHGCVFAILNGIPLRRYPREEVLFPMESRMQTLEEKLGLCGEDNGTCTVYSDYHNVATRLEIERARSFAFLKNALGMEQDS